MTRVRFSTRSVHWELCRPSTDNSARGRLLIPVGAVRQIVRWLKLIAGKSHFVERIACLPPISSVRRSFPMPQFRVEALENFIVRTLYVVPARSRAEAEPLCRAGQIAYESFQIEEGKKSGWRLSRFSRAIMTQSEHPAPPHF